MIPRDQEDRDRIVRHLEAREGWGFTTLEQPTDLTELLSRDDVDKAGAFLMDSVTALLSNEMFQEGGVYDSDAGTRVAGDLVRFAAETGNTVFVSDYIYADAGRYDEWTENYRRSLAWCDRALAQVCDRVLEASFGTFREWK
jgi:adenosylcobinamide kinase/adenosylcobinamide-phosphate guanylyltransferase